MGHTRPPHEILGVRASPNRTLCLHVRELRLVSQARKLKHPNIVRLLASYADEAWAEVFFFPYGIGQGKGCRWQPEDGCAGAVPPGKPFP